MTIHDDAGFGCAPFGHLASAFVDGELPRTELDRYATHLPGCADCQRLCAQYRAIDIAAMPSYPRPTEAEWDAAWAGVRRAVDQDRSESAASPAASVLRFVGAALPRSAWVRPLAAAVAAAAIIGLTLAVRQAWAPDGPPTGVASNPPRPTATLASAALGEGTSGDVTSVACQAGWEPVVWTLGGDEPMTVVQCQSMEI